MYLFGSRGEATAQGESDYDLLVIASLPSLLASIRKITSLRSALYDASPVPVDLVFMTPQSVFRSRSSLFLMVWDRSAKLIYGRRDIFRDLSVGSFAPDETSVFYKSCQEAMYLVRYINVDKGQRISIDQRALNKMRSMLLAGDILGAESLRGRTKLASSIGFEAMKETFDTQAVSRLYANFLREIREQSRRLGSSGLFRTLTFSQGKGQYQFVNALMYFFQSMEEDPPNVDLLRRASRLLDGASASKKVLQELKGEDPFTLWSQVKSRIFRNPFFVTSINDYPFGLVVGRGDYLWLVGSRISTQHVRRKLLRIILGCSSMSTKLFPIALKYVIV